MAKPEKRIQVGAVSASIFVNEVSTPSGTVQARSVSLQRVYKKGNEWKNGTSLRVHDIPKAITALQKAYEYLVGVKDG